MSAPIPSTPDRLQLCDVEVQYRIGVPDAEREHSQRLLISLDLYRNLDAASRSDDLRDTTNYAEIENYLQQLGTGKEWKLIERLAGEIAETVLHRFDLEAVTVEIKKFILPKTKYVSVRLHRGR